MATQEKKTNEQQNQQSQGQPLTRGSQQGQGSLARTGGDPLGFILTPGDFFRMTPFS